MSGVDKLTDRLCSTLSHGVQQLQVPVHDHQIKLLARLILLISKWNRVYNLTAVRDVDDMVGRHILDSLSVLQWLPEPTEEALKTTTSLDVIDVGSGAGLPVLPLAIVRPDLQFLSVESNGKKTRFQHQAKLELELNNVRVQQKRIEDTSESALTIISRAFTAPEQFIRVVEKNCLPQSQVIIMLGQKNHMPAELPLGFSVSEIQEVDVPLCDAIRYIASCKR